MTERDLDELIHRYQKGLAGPDEVAFLEELQRSQLTELQPSESSEVAQQLDELGGRVWKNLLKEVDGPRYFMVTVRQSFLAHRHLLAASIVVLLGISLLPFLLPFIKDRDYQSFATNESATTPKTVTLPDKSTIILQGLSSIALHRDFNQSNRRVKLTGSAFFDVVRNAKKPFIIQSDDLLTKVLGTSFSINNREASPEIEVKVYTGRVSVQVNASAPNADNQELLLTPNLKAVFQKDSHLLREALTDNPSILTSEKLTDARAFTYQDQKLRYILKQIEDAYQITIILLNEDDGNRLLTGDLSDLTLYQKLNLICSATDMQYEIKGAKIILKASR